MSDRSLSSSLSSVSELESTVLYPWNLKGGRYTRVHYTYEGGHVEWCTAGISNVVCVLTPFATGMSIDE